MSCAADLRDDLDDLVLLAVALERYAERSDAVRNVLARLHQRIRSTHDAVMREASEALARAIASFGDVR